MKKSQIVGMIKFHTKAMNAYKASGQIEQANRAKKLLEELKKKLSKVN